MKTLFLAILSISTLALFGQKKDRLDSLTTVLERVYKEDQEPRRAIDSLGQKFRYASNEMMQHWKKITYTDSINSTIISNILDNYGWLSVSETSEKANSAFFLVIQHSDLKTREKYLPVLKTAVEQGKAKAKDYAYLVDRALMDKGQFQIFGSQLTGARKGELSFYPIIDEKNVNKRRKEIGLQPIEEYAKGLIAGGYVLPKKDLYKNKLILIGFVTDSEDQKPINGAEVYLGNNSLIAKTDVDGRFKTIIDQRYKSWAFIIRKPGYVPMASVFENGDREVYTMGLGLRTIKPVPNNTFIR